MSAQTITESFRKLSPTEKIRVLQELWDEVAEEVASEPLSESQKLLLDQRIQQHVENPSDVEPWDRTRDDILSELTGRSRCLR
jgi:putative addiction module component (TIGR02574 family)